MTMLLSRPVRELPAAAIDGAMVIDSEVFKSTRGHRP